MPGSTRELEGVVKVPFAAAADLVSCVEGVHDAIAGRTFRAIGPAAGPVRLVHELVTSAVYGAIRASATGAGLGAAAVSRLAPAHARDVSKTRAGAGLVGALNGVAGDRLRREDNGAAVGMAVRTDGRDVPLERSALAAAFPQAGERVVVFVHGLCGSEHSWIPTAGPELSFGARLESDLGWTPVFIRYNSGLHISESGRSLAGLLEELLRAWPVPVIELALVGHSMGGLVCRSACHYGQAAGDAWTSRLRHVFCLGSPHLGAPLEKTANAAAAALGLVAETRPFARLLNLRSVGIKDLRFGALVEDDWQGRDPDAFLADTCSDVALLPAVRYHAIAATVTASARHPVGHVFGDLLVRLPSASGEGRRRRIGFDFEPRHRLGGLHHFHLLHHPAVYELIREALASGPGGRPAAVERQLPRDLPRLRRGRQSRG